MVRFSDMLGRSGAPDDDGAANSPYAELANDTADPESDAEEPRHIITVWKVGYRLER